MKQFVLAFRRKWIFLPAIFILLVAIPALVVLFLQSEGEGHGNNGQASSIEDNPMACLGSTCAGGGEMIAELALPFITRNQNDFTDAAHLFVGAPPATRLKEVFRWNENDESRGFKLAEGSQSLPSAFNKQFQLDHVSYVSRRQSFRCDGDILFDGDILVENLEVKATNTCRIFATGSILVSGGLRVEGSSGANLQLVSATAVIIGLKEIPNELADDCHTEESRCVASDVSYNYEHLLIVAPSVRFLAPGHFRGVAISEIASIPNENFEKSFDPVFASRAESILPSFDNADYFVYQRE